MLELVVYGFFFWLVSAAGGMALLARLTRGSRHRRRWLILGGMLLLPPVINFHDNPYSIVPLWSVIALGLVYDPGALFRLKYLGPAALYFGGGAAVTAIGLAIIDKFRKDARPIGSDDVPSQAQPDKSDDDTG